MITKVVTQRSGHRVPVAGNTRSADASPARMDHCHVLGQGSGRHDRYSCAGPDGASALPVRTSRVSGEKGECGWADLPLTVRAGRSQRAWRPHSWECQYLSLHPRFGFRRPEGFLSPRSSAALRGGRAGSSARRAQAPGSRLMCGCFTDRYTWERVPSRMRSPSRRADAALAVTR